MVTAVQKYSNTNPHYTPSWLSEELARSLKVSSNSTILDPACGSGNLLLAVGEVHSQLSRHLRYVGVDIRKQALGELHAGAKRYLTDSHVRLIQKDFLALSNARVRFRRPLHIIMNPPFLGYGVLSKTKRENISRKHGLNGRFNLAHAFVVHAIEEFGPDELVALLPCTWARSRSGHFRSVLDRLGGSWTWSELPNNPFDRVATRVGILKWRNEVHRETIHSSEKVVEANLNGFEVRSGTATGLDNVYRELASVMSAAEIGKVVDSVRGRDVGRNSSKPLWIPPRSKKALQLAENSVPKRMLVSLGNRSCVLNDRRSTLEFHESPQSWFLDEPKLLLPEINSGKTMRVTADLDGRLFPLHSTIAIRTKTKSNTKKIGEMLSENGVLEELRRVSPRLQGSSFRLTVGVLREYWNRSVKRKRS